MSGIEEREISTELKYKLRHSLPFKLFEVVSNLAVRVPRTNELIFLKVRPYFEDTPISKYIEYDKVLPDMFYSYEELVGKFVIVDKCVFNMRGRALLDSL